MNLLRYLLRKNVSALRSRCQRILLRAIKFLLRFIPGKMSISYFSGNQFDGAGAQLQRLASLYALSRYLNIDFIKTPLLGVTVHATDPFRTEDDYKQYLTRVGNFLHQDALDCNHPDPNCKSINFSILSAFTLFKIVILNIFQRYRIHLNVFQTNSIIDSWPKLITDFVSVNKNELKTVNMETSGIDIAIHYRQGAGGFRAYPGQKLSRQIEIDIYSKILKKCINKIPSAEPIRITVFTDSPREETDFIPPKEQLSQWSGTPGFDGNKITITPTDFQPIKSFASNQVTVSIEHGGDPLEALVFMTQADILIMSRSSLSYLAGLLNLNGTVYFPINFWHSPLRSWEKFRDE